MKPEDILLQAAEIIQERGQTYGDFIHNLQLAADIASLRLGRPIHPYEVCVMMIATKNARAFVTPDHSDSHTDAAVYEIFAQILGADYNASEARNQVQVRFRGKDEQRPATIAPLRQSRAKREPDMLADIARLADTLPAVARDAG